MFSKTVRTLFKLYLPLLLIGGIAVGLSLLLGISTCPSHFMVGIPCFACGMTRAFLRFFALDIRGAFHYHPLFIVVPFVPLLFVQQVPPKVRTTVSFILIALLIAAWIVRMVLFFPHTAPMDFNENALLARLFISQ